jgi:hypothetical protein
VFDKYYTQKIWRTERNNDRNEVSRQSLLIWILRRLAAGDSWQKQALRTFSVPEDIMGRTIAFTVVRTMAAVTSALAQGQGDAKERAACRPDVMRFCKQFVKDNNEDVVSILNCLESNRSRISKACSDVLSSHGQ